MTTDPVVVEASTPAVGAAQAMRDLGVGAVLVVDQGELLGVITDRDIAVRGIAEGRDPLNETAGDLCSTEVVSVAATDSVERALALMRKHALHRLPVTDNGVLAGIVSLGDLAKECEPESTYAAISSAPPNC